MAKINLLPWRADRRKQRQTEYFTVLGLTAAAAALVAFGVVSYVGSLIDNQNARNAYLTTEIQALEVKIKEIEELDLQKSRLLARKQVIEQLQANRSQMVHLFDELVRTIPEGVKLASIKQAGELLTLDGTAQSNARVSSYMRNIEASEWMKQPDLTIIEAKGDDASMPYTFTLKATMSKPVDPDAEEGADDDVVAVAGGAR
jgi:type IV pilus assembly protein PilN